MRILAVCAALLFLTGCSSFFVSKDEVNEFYVLNPIDEIIEVEDSAPVRLGLQRPSIPEWLDTNRIILRREENEVDFYAKARWVMSAGDMVGFITTESLENNSIANDVYYAGSETLSDYMLMMEVIAFDAYYEDDELPPVAEVTLQGRLLAMPDSLIHYSFTTTHRTQAANNEMSDIVEAFDTSLQACMEDVVFHTAKGLAVKYETR
jgi:ABC-type uncharacterized transport system auxiliary subunit